MRKRTDVAIVLILNRLLIYINVISAKVSHDLILCYKNTFYCTKQHQLIKVLHCQYFPRSISIFLKQHAVD